ncbi:hypothetical protein JTB14_037444 [Gonioctena quinquepunctata]|nr:hypothetical protein JTB14_037444 [Gonioctena quinquepunctata]
MLLNRKEAGRFSIIIHSISFTHTDIKLMVLKLFGSALLPFPYISNQPIIDSLNMELYMCARACYAEFGVRVPHTTGSAYMYSYVTVGEFIAFVIGWNMILEYLIGTSACACALSACFDALANGAISSAIHDSIGKSLGRDPDFLAFVITLLMMLLLAAGVKKSLIFNNILNVINLAVWVFVMTAGLFYVNTDNWTKHKGFLPKGWSGVFTGAATCFYAFIGFDIIATTGEEAATPKKSIPLAIISSLAIILVAYVTSSMMLTLIESPQAVKYIKSAV